MNLLTLAQRRALDRDDIAWEGWDAHGQPVLRDDHCRYAVTKNGARVRPTEPIHE